MRSIQSKYVSLIAVSVLLSALLVGALAVYAMSAQIDADTADILNLRCRDEASRIDNALASVEQSVNVAGTHGQHHLKDLKRLQSDEDYRKEVTDELEDMLRSLAPQTTGAVAYYFRYNSDSISSTDGFLYAKGQGNAFIRMKPTDISLYDPEDIAHVGWYYVPVQAGKALWMEPYWNDNLQEFVASYVMPMYIGQELAGVAGMDVDFNEMLESVQGEQLYESGYAFLVGADGNVISHPSVSDRESYDELAEETEDLSYLLSERSSGDEALDYTFRGVEKKMVYTTLENGMKLVMVARTSEIYGQRMRMIRQIMVVVALSAIIFALIGILFARRVTRPLERLTEASHQIAAGNLDVRLEENTSRDEVGELTRAFQKTVRYLKHYIKYIHSLAYRDGLTGLRNKTAYDSAMERIEADMELGVAKYALAMVDLNFLKKINDTYGHEHGNDYLLKLCRMLKEIFRDSSVFRIGGDEFLVLVEDQEYEKRDELFRRLQDNIAAEQEKDIEPWEKVSAAVGVAVYDAETDKSAKDVFDRADALMYENKLAMKAQRVD